MRRENRFETNHTLRKHSPLDYFYLTKKSGREYLENKPDSNYFNKYYTTDRQCNTWWRIKKGRRKYQYTEFQSFLRFVNESPIVAQFLNGLDESSV